MIRPSRKVRRERLSPLLGLPSFQGLAELPASTLEPLGTVLGGLRDVAAAEGPRSWRKRKAPMAAYWMAVAAHAGAAVRTITGRCGIARPRLAQRSGGNQRNPVRALAECPRLVSIPSPEKAHLRAALGLIRAEASALADGDWPAAPDAAAYWRAVSVYAGHLSRAVDAAAAAEQCQLLHVAGEETGYDYAAEPM